MNRKARGDDGTQLGLRTAADAAFAGMYERHEHRVRAYCERRLERADARVAATRAFLTARSRIDDAPPASAELVWLYSLAAHAVADLRRASPPHAPDQLGARRGRAAPDRTRAALGGLAARDREILCLEAWEDLEPAAIAAILGGSVASVAQRRDRAAARLGRELVRRHVLASERAAGASVDRILDAVRAADPVPDPSMLAVDHRNAIAFLDAHRPPRAAATVERSRRRWLDRLRRAMTVVVATAVAAAALGAVSAGVWAVLRHDGESAAPGPPTTTAPTTTRPAPATTQPPPVTTTTAPAAVPMIEATRVVAAGASYDGAFPAIALAPDGNPVIAHISDAGSTLRIAVCADPECVTLDGATSIGLSGPAGPHDLEVGADGIPVLVFVDVRDGSATAYLARCDDPSCSSHVVRELGIGDTPSLAIGPDGLPVALFANTLEEAAVVVRCTDPACAADLDVTIIESIRWRVGPLTLVGEGTPLIVQVTVTTEGSSVVRAAACTDVACTEVTTTDLAQVPPAAQIGGVVVDPAGIPTIFVVREPGEIVAIRCDDPACSSAGPPAGVGGPRSLGSQIGTAWGGLAPVVVAANDGAAFDPTAAGWLFRCDDVTCSSGTVIRLPGLRGTAAALAIGADAEPVVFFSRPGSGAFVLRCLEPDCADAGAAAAVPWTPESVAAAFEGLGPVMEGWSRADLAREEGGGTIVAAATDGARLVAVGHDCEFRDGVSVCRPMAWHADGPARWQRAETPPGPDREIGAFEPFTALVATDEGFVAAGISCADPEGTACVPSLWASPDGRSWTETPFPPGAAAACTATDEDCELPAIELVAFRDGIVALGTGTGDPEVWWRSPEAEWTEIRLPAPHDGTWVIDAIATDEAITAFGAWCETAGEDALDLRCSTTVWRSETGSSWDIVETGDSLANSLVSAATAAPDGLFAVGESCDDDWRCRSAVWWSDHGVEWEEITPSDMFGDVVEAIVIAPWGPLDAPAPADRLLVVAGAIDADQGTERGVFLIGSGDGAGLWRLMIGDTEVFGSGRLAITDIVPTRDDDGSPMFVAVGADALGPAIWVWRSP